MSKPALDRSNYSKLDNTEISRRIKSAERRMSRCVDMDAMVADMFAVQELEAALTSKTSVAA